MKRLSMVLLFIALWGIPMWAASNTITTSASTCAALANCLVVNLPQDKGGATLTLSGTWTGTISFEATGDGGATWVAVSVTPLASTTTVTSATANGTWQVNTAGFTGLRMRASATMSGSALATIVFSSASARSGGGGGGGGVTSIATTSPITGGTITTTGTIACATCLTTSSAIGFQSITPQNTDCHTACSPTAVQLSNAIASNMNTAGTGQANSAVAITGPTATIGMNFILILGAAEGASATWTYTSNTANVYLDGGTAITNIIFGNSALIGTSVSCFAFPITGPAVALKCTTLAGTVTTS